ncbi:L-lysine exporter family protein LysE/ArgO [Fontibacillus solani]|uniref:L-lysine exporter family protein LysE/ArgO n=1 Tax=Fontibacillus solani TaxID=1572857 RepID=A0A7W3SPL1_9BACL|nr:LysE/ArgO family amino acid transporter [Fontibacillus solani]MBA9083905.1 L-lysine exporter family protein LysE/ArgO [Fontibacillus solani]
MLTALIHGIALAFGLILPLGAQNVFIFNQGASQARFRKAIPVIVTASLCDTLLILLSVLGVSVIVLTIPALQTALFSIGILFLIYMGWSIWKSEPASLSQKEETSVSVKKGIIFAMSVSLLNPHAILDTVGVIGTSSLNYQGSSKVAFTLACILVSWIWFFGLALAGKIVGDFDNEGKFMRIINKISALIIWAVAIYIGFQLYDLLK